LRPTLAILAITVAPLFHVTPSLAQGGAPTTISGGLFGTARSHGSNRDLFTVGGAVSEAIDSSIPPEFRDLVPVSDTPVAGGASTMLLGAADYAHTSRHLQIAATGFGAYRYGRALNRFDTMSQSAGFGAVIGLPAKARVRIDQSVAYSPSYLYQLYPGSELSLGQAIPVAPDYQVVQTNSLNYHSNATFTMTVRRRTHVTASTAYDRSDFRGALAEQPQLGVHSFTGGVVENISRSVQFSVEYLYHQSGYRFGAATEHNVALGAEYSRRVSRSRRATFRGHITPTVVISDQVLGPVGEVSISHLQGDVGVDYEFRPGWKASGTWQRQVDYIAVVPSPLLANAGRASVTGLITRRLDLTVSAGYAKGETVVTNLSRIDSRATNARVRYALSRSVALYGEYVQFSYYYVNGLGNLGSFLPGVFHEHGLRIGAMLWKPVF
jgi:hypothetical protein